MTITSGPNLGLMVNGVQGEVHYTQLMRLLRGLDALVMAHCISRVASLPTTGLTDGDVYLSTADNRIARWSTALTPAAWEYYVPRDGWFIYSQADDATFRFDGTNWAVDSAGGGGMANPMTMPGDLIVGGTSGAPTRLAASSTLGRVLTLTASGVVNWADPVTGKQRYVPVSSSAASLTLNDATTTIWGITLSANLTTLTLPVSTGNAIATTLVFTQDAAGGRTVAWPSNLTFVGGEPSVVDATANAKTIINVLSVDGGSTYLATSLSSFAGGTLSRALNEAPPASFDTSSATVIPAATLAQANEINVSGTAGLTGLGNLPYGSKRWLKFNSVQTLKNSLSFSVVGGSDITTNLGDSALMYSLGSGSWEMKLYSPKDGSALVSRWNGGAVTLAIDEAAPFTDTGSAAVLPVSEAANTHYQGGSGDITSLAPFPQGAKRTVLFTTARRLVNSAALQLISNQDIYVQPNDSADFYSQGNGVAVMLDYRRWDGTALKGTSSSTLDTPLNQAPGVEIAAAASISIGDADSDNITITGSGTISNLGTARNGTRRLLRFANAGAVLTASSKLILQAPGNITARAKDTLEVLNISDVSGDVWAGVNYTRGDGKALVESGGTGGGGGEGGGSFTGGKLSSALNEAGIVTIPCENYLNMSDADASNTVYIDDSAGGTTLYALGTQDDPNGISFGAERTLIFLAEIDLVSGNGIDTGGPDLHFSYGDSIKIVGGGTDNYNRVVNIHRAGNVSPLPGFTSENRRDYDTGEFYVALKADTNDYATEMRLVPKGPGMLTLGNSQDIYTGVLAAAYTVNLQRGVDSGDQTTRGDYSALLGGQFNMTQGQSSVVLGGERNLADGLCSFIGGGSGASTWSLYYSTAFASNFRNVQGDTQTREVVMSGTTVDTDASALQAGGGSLSTFLTNHVNMTNPDSAMMVTVNVIARSNTDRMALRIDLLLYTVGYQNLAIEGTPLVTEIARSAGAAGWSVTPEAYPAGELLLLNIQGSAGQTVEWTAKVSTVETFG